MNHYTLSVSADELRLILLGLQRGGEKIIATRSLSPEARHTLIAPLDALRASLISQRIAQDRPTPAEVLAAASQIGSTVGQASGVSP